MIFKKNIDLIIQYSEYHDVVKILNAFVKLEGNV